MQSVIDRVAREKALQAMAEVSHGQLAMCNGVVAEANSQTVDLAAINTKVAIKDALAPGGGVLPQLDGRPAKRIKRLCRVRRSFTGPRSTPSWPLLPTLAFNMPP